MSQRLRKSIRGKLRPSIFTVNIEILKGKKIQYLGIYQIKHITKTNITPKKGMANYHILVNHVKP